MGEERDSRRQVPSRAAATAAAGAALALLAIAAAGSSASPFGAGAATGRARTPDTLLWGVLMILASLLLLLGIVAAVLTFLWREQVELPKRARWQIRSVLILLGLVALAAWWQSARDGGPLQPTPVSTLAPPPGVEPAPEARPESAGWLPLLAATGLLIAWVGAAALAEYRRRRFAPVPGSEAERLAELVDEALLDLAAETDPRRAVIAAYAVMERGLAAAGLPRGRGETPLEHTTRTLLDAHVPAPPVTTLAALFERARFSAHPIDPGMRDQALAALGEVRAALRERAEAAAAAGAGEREPA